MDEWEVVDTVPAHTLEDGDNIVYNGQPISLVLVNDNIDHIYIEWENDFQDSMDATLDPDRMLDLWRYV